MLSFNLDAKQVEQAMQGIKNYRDIVKELGPKKFRTRFSSILRAEIRKQFETKGSHLGTPWPPLSEAYKRKKSAAAEKYGYSRDLLKRTLKYYKALTEPPTEHRLKPTTENFFIFGLKPESFMDHRGIVYPVIHEEGTEHVPARPVFAAMRHNEKLETKLIAGLKKLLEKQLAGIANK